MKNIRYPVLLLDADRTLFDFEKSKAAALQAAYQGAGLEAVQTYSPEILARYSDINESWWRRLERGECTKPQLQMGGFGNSLPLWRCRPTPPPLTRCI